MGIQALGRLKSMWRDTDITTRMKVLKAIVFPMATYGCESWVFTGRVEKKITVYENKCTRKILRIPYTKHVTNEEVRKVCLIGKEELLRTVKRRKAEVFWTYGAAQQLAEDCDGGQSNWKTGKRTSEKKM